jgi:DNA (cytosine-5)-methyltransferase 1
MDIDWGKYEAAIRRWETVLGRPAPEPTEIGPRGNKRLSPIFVEWMMGLEFGWVTEFDFARKHLFRILGNGVVPQQAVLAITGLIAEEFGVVEQEAA